MGSNAYYQYVVVAHNIYQRFYEGTQRSIDIYRELILEAESYLARRYKEAEDELIGECIYFLSDIDEYNNKIKELEAEGKSFLIKANKYKDKMRELEEEML